MGIAAQGIDDPAFEVFKFGPDIVGNFSNVRQVGDIIDPKAERLDRAVIYLKRFQGDWATSAVNCHITVNRVDVEDWWIG